MSHVLPRFWSAGATGVSLDAAVLTHRPGLASEPTATFLREVHVSEVGALESVLDQVSEVTGAPCPRIFLCAGSPPWLEAELVARDWHVESSLQLVLSSHRGLTLTHSAETAIRPAQESDWDELRSLFRADHEEEDHKFGRPVRARHRTDQVVQARRNLALPVQYFVAEDDGIVGFVAGWPGADGLGLVEDLFVRADHRGRGLATALIDRAVSWARTGGAGPVVIGAEPDDTPKHLYARLGFTPTEMLRVASPLERQSPASHTR